MKAWYSFSCMIFLGILSSNIYQEIFKTIWHIKNWYSSKIFLVWFFSDTFSQIFKTIQHIKFWCSSQFFLFDLFQAFCSKIYTRKYLKQFITQKLNITHTIDTSRPKYVNFSSNQFIIWKYTDIFTQKVYMNTWYSSKIFMNLFLVCFLWTKCLNFAGRMPEYIKFVYYFYITWNFWMVSITKELL